MTVPDEWGVYISSVLFGVGAFVAALYVGLIVWTARDIRSRSRDTLAHIMSVLLVTVLNFPGMVIYLLMRPHTKLAEEYERSLIEEAVLQDLEHHRTCPQCQHQVESDFVVCPYCHHQLRLRCVGCGRLLSPDWDVCPYCGRFRDQGQGNGDRAGRPVEEPAIHLASSGQVAQPMPDETATLPEASSE